MENIGAGTSLIADFPQKSVYSSESVWDLGDLVESNSLGFMELLGVHQDYFNSSSLFNTSRKPAAAELTAAKVESSCSDAVVNPPETPNSSSISSASSENVNEGEEGEEQQKKIATKKHRRSFLKPKKSNEKKREKNPRVAFMTKSEVDHLEDGYRWRKYGQKAVKNSPFPRSYYRCTTATCNVKKRVERSFKDPSLVVTTYEGQHIHPSPVMSRPAFGRGATGGLFGSAASTGGSFGLPLESYILSPQLVHYQQQTPSSFGVDYLNGYDHMKKSQVCNLSGVGLTVKDNGLLQDVVPSHMLKDE